MWTANKVEANDNMVTRMQIGALEKHTNDLIVTYHSQFSDKISISLFTCMNTVDIYVTSCNGQGRKYRHFDTKNGYLKKLVLHLKAAGSQFGICLVQRNKIHLDKLVSSLRLFLFIEYSF